MGTFIRAFILISVVAVIGLLGVKIFSGDKNDKVGKNNTQFRTFKR
jgi:hypothetical protein